LFNSHDVDRLVAMLAEDVVLRAPGVPCGDGADTCRDFYRKWFADFPDARLEIRGRHVTGGVAVEEGRFLGTHTGRAATGGRVALDYVQVSCVRDGKQVLVELRFDRLLMLGQLGLVGDIRAAA
jgi:ketosteroid isomerase-like protein